MSWLRGPSLSFARQVPRALDARRDYEPRACYSSFCKHWQQAHEIITKSQFQSPSLHDDVLGVVNHLEQLSTLVALEARAREHGACAGPPACLEHLLAENLLDTLHEWAVCTGKYENAVRLEQLKLFGSLVGHYSSQVIAAEPFLRPLLKLLSGFKNELPPPNLENQLVTVLNQLCVALMQDMKLVDLFFLTTHTQNGSQAEFIIVRLLLGSVHREGGAGAAARDALLLCAKMSARSAPLARCMLEGNTCVVLATGLSGLYSHLPRTLADRVHRLAPDDVNQVHKLTLFVDSLEFCNAVAQVAHPSIKKHLLDLLSQGFLVPVMGPALLQRKAGLQSGAAEQAAATAYLELAVRCATRGGLLRAVLRFLFVYEYDGVRVADVLLARLDGDSQLSLVSLALMETLVDLNCEDVMLELVYKHLLNGHHLMVNHRHHIADPEPYRQAAVAFLGLTPRCCHRPLEKTREWTEEMAISGRRVLDFKKEDEGQRMNGVHGDIAMSCLVQEVKFNYGNPNDTLLGNYHAYLCDARFEIVSRTMACASWTSAYDSVTPPKKETNNNSTPPSKETDAHGAVREQDSLISVCTSGYETLKTSDTSEKEQHSLTSLNEADEKTNENQASDGKEHDSLSIGESSGYDSFKYKTEECDEGEGYAEESFRRSFSAAERGGACAAEVPLVRSWRTSAESIIGPLLSSLLRKAAALLESEVSANCLVTGVISRLAALPTPLLTSLLLCPGFHLQPNVPSLFQAMLLAVVIAQNGYEYNKPGKPFSQGTSPNRPAYAPGTPSGYPSSPTTPTFPGASQNDDIYNTGSGSTPGFPGSSGYPTGPSQGFTGSLNQRPQGYPSQTSSGIPFAGQSSGGTASGGFQGQTSSGFQGQSGQFGSSSGTSFQGQSGQNGGGFESSSGQTSESFGSSGSQGGSNTGAYEGGDYSAIPGEPDKDYPILTEIPQTSFRCDAQPYPGYYADVEARCQVFHVCANNRTFDFLCPNGTIFSQQVFVCVWWNQFDCSTATSLYELNANLYDYSISGAKPQGDLNDYSQGSQGSSSFPGSAGAQDSSFGGRPGVQGPSSGYPESSGSSAVYPASSGPQSNFPSQGQVSSSASYPGSTGQGPASYPGAGSQGTYPGGNQGYPSGKPSGANFPTPGSGGSPQGDTAYPAQQPNREYLPPRN